MTLIHCFSCNKVLEKVFKDSEELQPYGGTMFYSEGNYGSTVWDPMGEGSLLITICDECMIERSEVITEYPTGSKDGKPWVSHRSQTDPPTQEEANAILARPAQQPTIEPDQIISRREFLAKAIPFT